MTAQYRQDGRGTGHSKAKQRILDAAAKLYRERGYARATVRELADEVGILSGSLFHHFKTKDEILFAVMEGVIAEMDAALCRALDQAPSTPEQLRALVRTQLEFLHGPQRDATAVLLYEWQALSGAGRARLLERRSRYFSRWNKVFEQAAAEGLIRVEPAVLRQLLHGALVWSANWFDPKGGMSLDELEQSVLAMITAPPSAAA